MHPLGFTFDARWYHMTIAQRYALSGKVWPFPEKGYWNAAWPHLFSYQYTWAFLAPLPVLFDRLELCAHLEVMTFLMTLAQVPVVVRRLRARTRAWGCRPGSLFLLFPGIYLYDGNLNVGADHFAGILRAADRADVLARLPALPDPRTSPLFACSPARRRS